ncbi:hypothetical protein JRQ81_001870 [Phrynocephalus forsythii]|uniref:Uncharacterized protein n=1 Tax=Phrynocephalus forsythii TaxID=171643 RepID=A0A9Q0Y7Z3_9SAUR|nr:hypothetical protein JRQ81_001870 [Phrynocephalus forsythii]
MGVDAVIATHEDTGIMHSGVNLKSSIYLGLHVCKDVEWKTDYLMRICQALSEQSSYLLRTLHSSSLACEPLKQYSVTKRLGVRWDKKGENDDE